MLSVGIYRVGYVEVDIKKTCASLNRYQEAFRFVDGGTIAAIGQPDLVDYGYSDNRFAQLLSAHSDHHDFLVAVTSVPIEGNFFTRTLDELRAIIITAFQSEELLAKSGRSAEQRLALSLCAELTSFEFQRVTGQSWRDLFHLDPRGCVFDFAGIKSQAVGKLRTFDMCQPCKGKLAATNMDQGIICAVKRILDRIRRPSIGKAVGASVASPGLSFFYGGIVISAAVNVASGLLLRDGERWGNGQLVLAATLVVSAVVFPLAVYVWHWISYLRLRLE